MRRWLIYSSGEGFIQPFIQTIYSSRVLPPFYHRFTTILPGPSERGGTANIEIPPYPNLACPNQQSKLVEIGRS
jgi:hypothetical protein